jgi:glycosyltransferase involved in cell wall biosynthesis
MKFLIVTHTPHFYKDSNFFAYGPYITEMNLWLNNVDECMVVAPLKKDGLNKIHLPYQGKNIVLASIPSISFTSFFNALNALVLFPYIFFIIFFAMRQADHIHIRCPGNIGLIGCLVQVLFPKKSKTVKYAGNWDPKAQQPLSYKIQKWIVSNTFLTKNCKVLVYGEWQKQSKNIKPFFTATYNESSISDYKTQVPATPFSFLFVGSLVKGKRPMYAIKFVERLINNGISCTLDIYGEGFERGVLEIYCENNGLTEVISLHGNQDRETVQKRYKKSDFLILASKSEGWPKVVAEAMFWGCIPLATEVSCVPWMLGQGRRGILLTLNIDKDTSTFTKLLSKASHILKMQQEAQKWSHNYTLDSFEAEIKKLLV